jgi:hypothetical protein
MGHVGFQPIKAGMALARRFSPKLPCRAFWPEKAVFLRPAADYCALQTGRKEKTPGL